MTKEQDFGEVINYVDGFAYGVTPEGRTVCLGSEGSIKAILGNPRRKPENEMIARIVGLERQLAKKVTKKELEEQTKIATGKKARHQQAVELGVAKKTKPRKNKIRA